MVKLKYLIREFNNKILYHVAPDSQYDSIDKYGLDPQKATYDISTDGNYIYGFESYTEASNYKNYMEHYDKYEPFNIWKIDTYGLKLEKDYDIYMDSDDENTENSTAYKIKAPISRNKIKFVE